MRNIGQIVQFLLAGQQFNVTNADLVRITPLEPSFIEPQYSGTDRPRSNRRGKFKAWKHRRQS